MAAIAEFLDARIRRIGHVEVTLVIDAKSEWPRKMFLRRAVPGLQKSSIREKDKDLSLLCIRDVDRAAGIDGDSRRTLHF